MDHRLENNIVVDAIALPLQIGKGAAGIGLKVAGEAAGIGMRALGRLFGAPDRVATDPLGHDETSGGARVDTGVATPESPPAAPAPEPTTPEPPPAPAHVTEQPELVHSYAEPGAEDGPGASVHVAEPWKGYGHMTADDVVARLAAASPEELAAVELYERVHRGRRTVLTGARDRLRRTSGRGRRP